MSSCTTQQKQANKLRQSRFNQAHELKRLGAVSLRTYKIIRLLAMTHDMSIKAYITALMEREYQVSQDLIQKKKTDLW